MAIQSSPAHGHQCDLKNDRPENEKSRRYNIAGLSLNLFAYPFSEGDSNVLQVIGSRLELDEVGRDRLAGIDSHVGQDQLQST